MKFYDDNIDIIKGIGILFMVLGHCFFPLSHFIYLFHMPIFFMVAGYCYSMDYSKDVKSVCLFLKKRVKSLWYPFVFYNTIYLIMHNMFIKLQLLTNNMQIIQYSEKYDLRTGIQNNVDGIKEYLVIFIKIFLFGYEETFGGAGWFLRVLFVISILYCMIFYLGKKLTKKEYIVQIVISVFFSMIGYYLYIKKWNYENISVIFSCYILFHIGHLFRKKGTMRWFRDEKICFLLCISALFILLIGNKIGSINLVNNFYMNPIFLLVMSIAGWFFLYSLCCYIKSQKVRRCLVFVGQNTIPIIFMHFLGFKIITFIQVKLYDFPPYLLAAHPVLLHNNGWWILYGLSGVLVPLGIIKVVAYIKSRLNKLFFYF